MMTNGSDSGGNGREAGSDREPRLVAGLLGRRQVSLQALLERIEAAFIEEFGDTPALAAAVTAAARLKLLNETISYVLAVESAQPEAAERAALTEMAYSALFGYGPLDPLLHDANVTTIALDGPEKAAARFGHGDLVPVGPLFDSASQLQRALRRLLLDAGTDLYADQPIVETGLVIAGRRVCVNLIAPPLAPDYTVDIRLHPAQPPSLADLAAAGFLTAEAAALLEKLALSPHGIAVVGDTEAGKTTLLGALARLLPRPETVTAVERAGELHLPAGARRLVARWRGAEQEPVTFGEQIGAALAQSPGCLVLDEVRADEPESIAPLLREDGVPRQLWSFRGPFDSKRLRSALGMLARRSDMGQGEAQAAALYRRLPFVVTVWRSGGAVGLYSVGEWQFRQSDEYPDYVLLMQRQDGQLAATGEQPALPLG